MLVNYNEKPDFSTNGVNRPKHHQFKSVGVNVLISDKASIFGAERIIIGNNVRIDDFAIISAGEKGIIIGDYVHIACYASLIGQEKIVMDDYSGISSRVAVYSSSDSYDGEWMTNPCVPAYVRNTKHSPVYIGKHVVIGTGSTVLPGVTLRSGCAVGAMSLIMPGEYGPLKILVGIPAKVIKNRQEGIYSHETLI